MPYGLPFGIADHVGPRLQRFERILAQISTVLNITVLKHQK